MIFFIICRGLNTLRWAIFAILKEHNYNYGCKLSDKREDFMPTISMFFGIIIRMYFGKKEHNPPHFHAYYQDYKGTFNIESCELIDGNIPLKKETY